MRKPTLYQSLKAKRRSQQLVIGVTWYTPESWAAVKATATDPECFEDSFDKWKTMAVAARRNFQRSGVMALDMTSICLYASGNIKRVHAAYAINNHIA